MKPLVRWIIGSVQPAGFECLKVSIETFLRYHDAEVLICHNCPAINLAEVVGQYPIFDQRNYKDYKTEPLGVAWKLYPPRMDITRHEIVIDNDIVFNEPIPEIEEFFQSDKTLLLEDQTRTYGRFDKHVPPGFQINSGIYGMCPGFNLQSYVDFYADKPWEENAKGPYEASKTFDEQGLTALGLLSYPHIIIPQTSITNCEHELVKGKGHHFVGVNRNKFHRPFRLYQCKEIKLYL